jgi:hypothetical protein
MEETLRHQLAQCLTVYEGLTGVKPSTVSRRAVNDARFVERVLAGEGFTVRTYDKVIQWLSDHWPEPNWPEGVPRPAPQPQAPSEGARARA